MRASQRGRWMWVQWLAVLAMLMHAGFAVRHNAHELGIALAPNDGEQGVICASDPAGVAALATDQQRQPAAAKGPCPACPGSVGGYLSPPLLLVLPFAYAAEQASLRPHDRIAQTHFDDAPPPNRGPPRSA